MIHKDISVADFTLLVQKKLQSLGLVEAHPIADGSLHRCPTTTKPQKKNGAYVLYMGSQPFFWAKNWETTAEECVRGDFSEAKAHREERRKAWQRSLREKMAMQEKVAVKAKALWKDFLPAQADNAYLRNKHIKAVGVKESREGTLVVPMYDNNNLVNLQFIFPDAKKRFLKGGKKQGCFFGIADNGGDPRFPAIVCIAEGYATSVSIHMATGLPVLCAFDCGNLEAVARQARRRYPTTNLCLCADCDSKSPIYPNYGGVGLAKAIQAARLVGGCVAVPEWEEGDFNDLFMAKGAAAVQKAVADRRSYSAFQGLCENKPEALQAKNRSV